MTRKEQENEIIKLAFFEELEKHADWKLTAAKTLSSFFRGAGNVAGKLKGSGKAENFFAKASKEFGSDTGSWKKGTEYLGKFKGIQYSKGKDGFSSAGRNAPKAEDSMFARAIANTMTEVGGITSGAIKGMSKKQSVLKNTKTLIGNLKDDVVRQVRGARLKTMTPDKYQSIGHKTRFLGGKSKSKYLTTNWGTKRKIVGKDAAGNPIIKKRLLPAAGALAVTPVGMGAIGAATGDSKDGAADFLKWKTPIGAAEMNYDILKDGYNWATGSK